MLESLEVAGEGRDAAQQAGAGRTSLTSTVTYRAITLLELVSRSKDGIGVREAARATHIDRSAVSRLLSQLEQLGCVEQVADRGNYTAGPRLFSIAAAVRGRDSLWNAAEPILASVVARHNETCFLTVRQGDYVEFREKVDCRQTIRYVVELGKSFRLPTGAAGRAILSALPLEEAERILGVGLERYTDYSITDLPAYLKQLDEDRQFGYAVSVGLWVENGAGVASPYFDASGACVGALTLSCPADRLKPSMIPAIGQSIRGASRDLSHRLGYVGNWGPIGG